MIRLVSSAIGILLLAAAPQESRAFLYASGSDQASGDLVGVWIKNNLELIINLGPIDDMHLGPVISFTVPGDFGDLIGAKFLALGVPNPSLTFQTPDGPSPAGNIATTTNGDPQAALGTQPLKVGDAQSQLDPPSGGVGWLKLLNTIPLATGPGTPVIENTDDMALISTALDQSYTHNLGGGGDSIAGQVSPLVVSVPIDPQGNGESYSIALYKLETTLTQVGNNFNLGLGVDRSGFLTGGNGSGGSATLSLVATPDPEPGIAGLAALAALGLLWRQARTRITA
jgi:hypothetical protein